MGNGTKVERKVEGNDQVWKSDQLLSLKKLGAIMAERRVLLGLSQDDLADQAQVHRSYISEIERGQRNFTIKVLTLMAESLNLSMSELLRESFECPVQND